MPMRAEPISIPFRMTTIRLSLPLRTIETGPIVDLVGRQTERSGLWCPSSTSTSSSVGGVDTRACCIFGDDDGQPELGDAVEQFAKGASKQMQPCDGG